MSSQTPPADPAASRAEKVKELALERTTLFLAAFGFALLVIKVVRVSHLNPRTAHGLIEDVGPVSVVLGSLVGHFPVILFIITVLSLWWALGSFALLRTFTPSHAGVATVLLFALLLLPWPYLIGLAVVGIARWIRARSAPHKVGRRSRHYYLLVGAFAVLLLADSDVWFPPETFEMADGTSFVGYALSEPPNSAGWIVILTDDERMIVRHRQNEVDARLPCRHIEEDQEFDNFPSLLQLAIREDARLPEPLCEEA